MNTIYITLIIFSVIALALGLGLGLGLGLKKDEKDEKDEKDYNKIMNNKELYDYVEDDFIERNIFQTHKSQEYINSNKSLVSAQNSWKQHKKYKYNFYDNDACDKFMKEEFSDIYDVYNNLPKPVMKADMWRYCIIYKYGGVYADADTVCNISNLDILFNRNSKLIGVPENKSVDESFFMCQWVFAAPKGSPILKSIIDLLIERSVEENEGEHFIHYKTGPGIFTDGIENWLKNNNLKLYKNKEDYNNYRDKNMHIYEAKNFHSNYINHLFSGSWENGWKSNSYK